MAIHQVCERDRERKEREGGIVMFVERVFFVFMCGCVGVWVCTCKHRGCNSIRLGMAIRQVWLRERDGEEREGEVVVCVCVCV